MSNKKNNFDRTLMDIRLQVPVMLSELNNKKDNYEVYMSPNNPVFSGWCTTYTGWCKSKDTGEKMCLAMKVGLMDGSATRFEKSFSNEISFYRIIFPRLDRFRKQKNVRQFFENLPRYRGYYSDADKVAYLFLENITPAGYGPSDPKQLLNREQLQMIFKIYGKFHALSFAYKHEHPDSFKEISKDLVDIRVCKHKQNDMRCMEGAYLAAVKNLDADIIKTFMNIDFKETVANARKYNGSYSCFTHVDYRLCNLMFKYDKTSNALENLKLINFQLACASTPVHDLSTIFYTHAGKTDMDKLDWYLRIYYDSFSEFLQELGGDPQQIYPCAVLIEEWRIYSAGAIVIGIAFWIQKLLDENELSSIASQEDQTKQDYIKFWTEKIAETQEGLIFQNRATDISKHAVEYGIF